MLSEKQYLDACDGVFGDERVIVPGLVRLGGRILVEFCGARQLPPVVGIGGPAVVEAVPTGAPAERTVIRSGGQLDIHGLLAGASVGAGAPRDVVPLAVERDLALVVLVDNGTP